EDRELRRGGAGEQGAGRVRILEGLGVHPPLAAHDEIAEEADVGGWAAEAGQPDPQPLPCDHAQRRHAPGSYWKVAWRIRTSSARTRCSRPMRRARRTGCVR